jgi:hypothetical protein
MNSREIRIMPEKKTLKKAKNAKKAGKSPSTQAGAFVEEEMEHIRSGKHGAKSSKQAIAIGLSKARRAGVNLPAPKKGKASEPTRKKAERDRERGQHKAGAKKTSATRSAGTKRALKREGSAAASHRALSKQAKSVAKRRSTSKRSSVTGRKKSSSRK